MKTDYDVLIVGGGPAGSSCAAVCARAGLRVLVVERAVFPRDKVCGDCLNPDCWPVLERLGTEEQVCGLPHAELRRVSFVSARGARVESAFPDLGPRGEIAVKRSLFDQILLQNAVRLGAEARHGTVVTGANRDAAGNFEICTAPPPGQNRWRSRWLVLADGRNSALARTLGMLRPSRERRVRRIGLQTHAVCPDSLAGQVEMCWFAQGYGGLAPVGAGQLNISLTGPAVSIPALKVWSHERFALPAGHEWRTIAPLDRSPARYVADARGIFLAGDVARVVEPFTGEGIYYALRSGELVGETLSRLHRREITVGDAVKQYTSEHRRMYQGRLWVNRLAKMAGTHSSLAGAMLAAASYRPEWLGYLTKKVVCAPNRSRGRTFSAKH